MVWPCQKDARGKNSETNHGMDTTGEKAKRKAKKNMDGRSPSGHDNEESRTRSVDTERNGVWFPEDGSSCYKTGWIDRKQNQIYTRKCSQFRVYNH